MSEDLDKLKKKLEQSEEEIEDLEDDLDNEKKKRRDAEAANTELSSQLSKMEKDVAVAKKAQSAAESLLAKSRDNVDTVRRSLRFVSEILNAESVNNEQQSDYARLSHIVDDIVSFVVEAYGDSCLSKKLWDFNPMNYVSEETKEERNYWPYFFTWSYQTKKAWLRGKKSIAFVGEFSAGKTSLVNRLLGQDVNDKGDKGVLYTSAKAATAVPTYVIGGDKNRFLFVTKDDELKVLNKETFASASKEVMGQIEGLPNLVKYFVMYAKCPALNHFSILDTPGFNSNDPADANRTMDVINECDALFWIIDVNTGAVNKSSLEIIKNGYDSSKPLYVVINKIDTKSPSEVASVKSKVLNDFKKAGVPVKGIFNFGFNSNLTNLTDLISSVEKEDDSDWIIDYIGNDLQSSVEALQESLGKYDKERRESSETVYGGVNVLSKECEDIATVAEECKDLIDSCWDPGLFNDTYTLSPRQGRDLMEDLSYVADEAKTTNENIKIFKGHVEWQKEAEQSFQDCSADLGVAKSLKARFNKLLKEYKELISK